MSRPYPLTAESLRGIDVFTSMSQAQRADIASLCSGRVYEKGEMLIARRDHATDVFFVVSGRLSVTIFADSGRQTRFRDLAAGSMFGELAAFDNKPRSADVVAEEETVIARVSADIFLALMERYPEVVKGTVSRLVGLVRYLTDRVFEYSTLSVQNRIRAELVRLAQDYSDGGNVVTISPAPTEAQIAHCVSTHREAVSRELSELKNKHGLIERQRGVGLVIKDIAALRALVQEGDSGWELTV